MVSSKNQYIALIRAINVGGRSIIKMVDLRELFITMGFDDVITYIQSGNVIFKSKEINRSKLASKIQTQLSNVSATNAQVFIKTPSELLRAAVENPFDPDRVDLDLRSHILFLSIEPSTENIKKLMSVERHDYKFKVIGDILYYAYHKKYEGHTRRTVNFEKILGVSGTARNWKVVNKLIELST
ncbi:MAG TPA: DUF1697 domain-containing protein [Candidatus Saccharimonadales bacterium]|nr:DUF1697 domain-containing protein [Candidatus Saccharimonadales bacterium]